MLKMSLHLLLLSFLQLKDPIYVDPDRPLLITLYTQKRLKINKLKLFKVSEKNIKEEINKKINHLQIRLQKIKEYELQNHTLSTKNKLINKKPNEIDSIDKLYDNIINIFEADYITYTDIFNRYL